MKFAVVLIVVTMFAANAGAAQSLKITGPNLPVLIEGQTYQITWSSDGLKTVSIIVYGTRTPMGQTSRGSFSIQVTGNVPAEKESVDWKTPWIDAKDFLIKAKGYDSSGHLATSAERSYGFRPAILANRAKDGIYLDLHQRVNQRLYTQKDGRITHVYFVSSSENYLWEPSNRHPPKPHDHAGVFAVQQKEPDHWSKQFHVHMYWAMRYLNGHYIHATSSNLYRLLGRPASHGCNRMTRYDAKQLYEMTPVGTRVEVIGPSG